MKKLLQLLVFILLSSLSFSQTLFVEEFNYTAGDVLTAHSWKQSGTTTTNPLTVTSPGLTYTGYPSAAGNACTLAVTGQDVYQSFSAQSSGDVYLSFLLNVQTASTGDYFIALSQSTNQTNYYLRVHIKSSGSGFSIGLSKFNEVTGGSIYGISVLNFNTTYLVVCKHTFVATADADDIESVFVFSNPNVPFAEPSTPEVGPYTNAIKNDPANLGCVTIRQGSSGSAATLVIDGIRISTSWVALLPQAGPTAPLATEATNVTTTGFTANWNASTGATNYWLDVSTVLDFSALVTGCDNLDVGNVTVYDISNLNTGKTYYYRVRASNVNGTSANSNIITVGTEVLSAPLALSAANISTIGFTARWNSSPTATSYLLDVSTTSDFSTFVTGYNGKDVGNVTGYNVTSLNGSTTYYYRVRASNNGGTSANSNTITVTTLLAAPIATAATNISTTGFTANWNSSTGATNYWIDISTKDDLSNILASYNNKSVGNVTTYNITSLNTNTTYYFRVCASNAEGTSSYSNTITVTTNATAVNDLLDLPTRFDLSQNYPNPFNPTTVIEYQVPENTFVILKVYNVLGSEVATLVNDMRSAGAYEVTFGASQLTSGIYFYKIQAGKFSQMKKMILVK